MTRDELVRQLEELKSRGRSVLFVGFPLVLLFELPIVIYLFEVQRAQPHSRSTAYVGLLGLALSFLIWMVFLVILRRTTVKYSPSCPICAKPITWRERSEVLGSGRCPRCKAQLFVFS